VGSPETEITISSEMASIIPAILIKRSA